jgi:hypothetical protein
LSASIRQAVVAGRGDHARLLVGPQFLDAGECDMVWIAAARRARRRDGGETDCLGRRTNQGEY